MTTHTFEFDYTYEMVPEGKRKSRPVIRHTVETVEIRDIHEADAPVALTVDFAPDKHQHSITYRWYNNRLWSDHNPYYDQPWQEKPNTPEFFERYTWKELMERVLSWADQTIYIDGLMWRCADDWVPFWHVCRVGEYPNSIMVIQPTLQVRGPFYGGWANYFNANQGELAYKYAEQRMHYRREGLDMPAEPIGTWGMIYVMMPEVIKFDAWQDVLAPDHSMRGFKSEARIRLQLEDKLETYYTNLKEAFGQQLEEGVNLLCTQGITEDEVQFWCMRLETWIKAQPYLKIEYDDRLKWILQTAKNILWLVRGSIYLTHITSFLAYLFNRCADESLTENY